MQVVLLAEAAVCENSFARVVEANWVVRVGQDDGPSGGPRGFEPEELAFESVQRAW